ncbi:hypothetical protein BVRB_5g122140 [Beta vulgaris subsp. vulgaris]|nr:hypothetical protein BVRB_5g122140 [Beta vulgaris subsp. vulgaris]
MNAFYHVHPIPHKLMCFLASQSSRRSCQVHQLRSLFCS